MLWKPSRLKSNFHKLGFQAFFFDLYLLRFRECSWAPWHKDPVKGKKHYRANLIVWSAKEGGLFQCDKTLFRFGPLVVFRPDLHTHCVSPIKEGRRYVLSLGWTTSDP